MPGNVEDDINDPDFDAKKYNISALIRILTKYDVDLPSGRQKKEFYVQLVMDHLDYMRKRCKDELKTTKKKDSFAVPSTPASETRRRREQKEIVSTTPLLPFKKRAVIESENESRSVFSDDNPFQTPGGTKTKKLTKKFTPSNIEVPDSLEAVDTQFSPVQPVFHGTPTTTLSEILKKSPSVKSPPSSRKKTPKKVEFEMSETPSKGKKTQKVEFEMSETPSKVSFTLVPNTPAPGLIPGTVPNTPKLDQDMKTRKQSLEERLLKRKRARESSHFVQKVVLGFIGIFLGVYGHWLLVDQPRLQYCSSKTNPTMTYSFLPACIECPKNAICDGRSIVGCVSSDYRLKQNPLEFVLPQFIPFPFNQPKCVWDSNRILKESKKQKQVDHLVQVLDVIVREFVGMVACTSHPPKQHKWIISSKNPTQILGMPVELAKEELVKLVKTKWTNQQFEEYWNMVLDKIQSQNGPLSTILDDTMFRHRIFTSSNPPVISSSCKMKRAIVSFAKRYAVHLSVFALVVLSIGYAVHYYNTLQYETLVFSQLVEDIIDAVHAEREAYEMDSQKHPIPGVPIIHIRDYFLPRSLKNITTDHIIDEHNRIVWYIWDEKSRNRIWKRVHQEVVKNSSIRETNTQVRGEAQTVWMWVGSSVLSPKKRARNNDQLFGTVSKVVSK